MVEEGRSDDDLPLGAFFAVAFCEAFAATATFAVTFGKTAFAGFRFPRLNSKEAPTKFVKSGCGDMGFDLNSGWN